MLKQNFRNGIEFGDSINTVQGKETYELTLNDKGDCLSCHGITVATIDRSGIAYYFEDDKLYKVDYSFSPDALVNQDNDTDVLMIFVAGNMNTVNNGLKSKYGEPIEESNQYSQIKTSTRQNWDSLIAVSKIMIYASNQSSSSKNAKLKKLGSTGNSYVVELDNGIVMIDHYVYMLMDYMFHQLTYEYFTYEQVQEKLQLPQTDAMNDL